MIESERQAERDGLAARIEAGIGVVDPRILDAFRTVPRHRFVPELHAERAYQDRALPIGEDQTISQPSMIALMLAALRPKPSDRALEVGAGSGYAAALLGELVSTVDAMEVRPALAKRAREVLDSLGAGNVYVHAGSGEHGLPDRAPFDVILVSAGARFVPPDLLSELAPGGRIAIPVGGEQSQALLVGERRDPDRITWEEGTSCVFVPLVTDERRTG